MSGFLVYPQGDYCSRFCAWYNVCMLNKSKTIAYCVSGNEMLVFNCFIEHKTNSLHL